MRHVTRYRAYPSYTIERRLFNGFAKCTFVRNHCLDNSVYTDAILPDLKKAHPELKEVQSHVLQKVIHRIVNSLKALKKMKEKGRRVGKLRKKWVHSMEFDSTGFKLTGNRLWLSKVGEIRIELSRPVPGRIKQVVIKHTRANKWFVSIISETPDEPTPSTGTACVGIDLNLLNFSTDTDGMVFEHSRNVRKSAKRLRRAQKKMSRMVKGSCNRRRQRYIVAHIHEQVENRRDDFLHKWSRYYVDRYDHIALEDLTIRDMVRSCIPGLNKSILDAAWGKARQFVMYKAANAGKYVHVVDPAYTSQDCFQCGNRVPKDLSQRQHICPVCGYTTDRDFNAAQNILKRASVGWGTPESTLGEMVTSTPPAMVMQVAVNEPRISRL